MKKLVYAMIFCVTSASFGVERKIAIDNKTAKKIAWVVYGSGSVVFESGDTKAGQKSSFSIGDEVGQLKTVSFTAGDTKASYPIPAGKSLGYDWSFTIETMPLTKEWNVCGVAGEEEKVCVD